MNRKGIDESRETASTGGFTMMDQLRDKLHQVKSQEDPDYIGDNPSTDDEALADLKKRERLLKDKPTKAGLRPSASRSKPKPDTDKHENLERVPAEEAEALVAGLFDMKKSISPRERLRHIKELREVMGVAKEHLTNEQVISMAENMLEYGALSRDFFLARKPKGSKESSVSSTEVPKALEIEVASSQEPKADRGKEIARLYNILEDRKSRYSASARLAAEQELRTVWYAGNDDKARRGRDNLENKFGKIIKRLEAEVAEAKPAHPPAKKVEQRTDIRSKQAILQSGDVPQILELVEQNRLTPQELGRLRIQARAQNQAVLLREVVLKEIEYKREHLSILKDPTKKADLEKKIKDHEKWLGITSSTKHTAGSGTHSKASTKAGVMAEDAHKDTRDLAQATFARLRKYTDKDKHPLWAENAQAGEKKFKQITREVWDKFAVHGIVTLDKHGKPYIKAETDLDGRATLWLLRQAGFDTTNVKYVTSGRPEEGRINIDTSNMEGAVVENDGKTVHIDHHTTKSGRENSSMKVAYEQVLTKLGLIEHPTPELRQLIDFVTKFDNLSYSPEEYGKKSGRTLLGLARDIGTKDGIRFVDVEKLFKAGKTPTTELTDEEMKDIIVKEAVPKGKFAREAVTLFDYSEDRLNAVNRAERRLVEMEKQGLIIDSKDYGRIVIDINNSLPTGADAAKASGAGMYVKWNPATRSFFVTSVTETPIKHKFAQGIPVRETMWIKPVIDAAPLTVKLADVLREVTNGEFEPTGELKKYLDQEVAPTITTPEVTEAELRQMTAELLDQELEIELEGLGMTEEEKEEERKSKYFLRQRGLQLEKLVAQFKK